MVGRVASTLVVWPVPWSWDQCIILHSLERSITSWQYSFSSL